MHIIRNASESIIRFGDSKTDSKEETWWAVEKIVLREDGESCKTIRIRLTTKEILRIADIAQGNFTE